MAGLIRCVRLPEPCRPTKFRLVVEAQRCPGSTRSPFIPTHIEHPASSHSKPALLNTTSRPSDSAWRLTLLEPGTTMVGTTARPCRAIATAADRRSSIQPLVQHTDEDAIDRDVADTRARRQAHIGERSLPSSATFGILLERWVGYRAAD